MEQTRKCSHVGFWIVIGLMIAFLIISLAMNVGLLISLVTNKDGVSFKGGGKGEDEFPSFTERWSYGSGDVKVVRIALSGPIFHGGEETLFGVKYDKVESVLRQIRAAKNDEDVKAIIFEVDSPGGEITSADEIYNALQDFKKSGEERKVIAYVEGLAASGGYYVSLPADWIIAQPTSILGSIGVIMQTLNWKGLSEKIGITDTTIKSGTNKDLLNPFHDVPPEQIQLLQTMIDVSYDRFFGLVKKNRNIKTDELKAMADGRIFDASVALDKRFIDQIGYWDDVVSRTAEILGVEKVKIVRYERHPELFELLSQIRLPFNLSPWADSSTPRFLYLWRP